MNPISLVSLILTLVGTSSFGILNTLIAIDYPASFQQKAIPFQAKTYQAMPIKKDNYKPYIALASSAIIYDINSAQHLYLKNPEEKRAVASLNKLMTAMVVMNSHQPDEIVTVGDIPPLGPYDVKIGITPGEKLKLSDLLRALLIHSANDAANALAIYDSGTIESFAGKMNIKAQEWGLTSSNFSNPSGLDAPNQLSSANDLLTISNILLYSPTFREIVKTPTTKIANTNGKEYQLTTTNKILGQNGIAGIKTGFTLNAGQCLITLAEQNKQKIITIVLDSPDRFQESKNMIDWAFNNYSWQ